MKVKYIDESDPLELINGKIYDVIFDHISVCGFSNGGCFASRIESNGYVENVIMQNCTTGSYYGVDYSTDLVWGRIAAKCSGRLVGVSYNGTRVGLVG